MTTHHLKTHSSFYLELVYGRKTFEVRKNDRDFKVGDILILKEYNVATDKYTGQQKSFFVSSVLYGGQFGIEKEYCVMSVKPINI